jgi:hypothetical protein
LSKRVTLSVGARPLRSPIRVPIVDRSSCCGSSTTRGPDRPALRPCAASFATAATAAAPCAFSAYTGFARQSSASLRIGATCAATAAASPWAGRASISCTARADIAQGHTFPSQHTRHTTWGAQRQRQLRTAAAPSSQTPAHTCARASSVSHLPMNAIGSSRGSASACLARAPAGPGGRCLSAASVERAGCWGGALSHRHQRLGRAALQVTDRHGHRLARLRTRRALVVRQQLIHHPPHCLHTCDVGSRPSPTDACVDNVGDPPANTSSSSSGARAKTAGHTGHTRTFRPGVRGQLPVRAAVPTGRAQGRRQPALHRYGHLHPQHRDERPRELGSVRGEGGAVRYEELQGSPSAHQRQYILSPVIQLRQRYATWCRKLS